MSRLKEYCKEFGRENLLSANVQMACVVVSSLMIVLVLGLSSLQATPVRQVSRGKVVVGVILDITGQGADRGRSARDALVFEERRINQRRRGGVPQILLVTIDTAGKAEAAATGVKSLVDEYGAVAIIGPADRASALSAAIEAERVKVPMLSLSAPEKILRPVRRWVFATTPPVSLGVRLTLMDLRTRGFLRTAILVSEDSYGAEGRENLSEMAPDLGISVLMTGRHHENEHNLLPYLQKAYMRGAEAFIHWARGPSRLALARARKALDIPLPIYMAPVSDMTNELQNSGQSLDGVAFPASRILAADLLPTGTLGLKTIQAYRRSFHNRFGRFPDGVSGSAADALRIVESALRNEMPRREQVREHIEKTEKYQGFTGTFHFSESDHNGLREDSLVMVQIRNGKWRVYRNEQSKKLPSKAVPTRK